jgi:hypothetical protein
MEKIKITISSVLNDLANSMTREEIRDKYSLTNAQLKQLFQHPQLKGRKTKQVNVLFELVDDVTPEVQEVVREITNPVIEDKGIINTNLSGFTEDEPVKVDNSILSTFE